MWPRHLHKGLIWASCFAKHSSLARLEQTLASQDSRHGRSSWVCGHGTVAHGHTGLTSPGLSHGLASGVGDEAMGWEKRTRCRFYPHCMIHTGERFVRDVEPDERAEIKIQHASGMGLREIGEGHRLDKDQVWQVLHQPTERYSTRKDWLRL